MPNLFHLTNRSKQGLNDPAAGSSSGSVSGDEARTERAQRDREARAQGPPQPFGGLQRAGTQPYLAQGISPDHDLRGSSQQPETIPSRSSSTRYSTPSGGYHQQSHSLSQASGIADELASDSRRYQQAPVPQIVQPPPAETKKRSLFEYISNKTSRHSDPKPPPPPSPSQGNYNNTSGLGRRLSKKEQSSAVRTQQPIIPVDQYRQDWQGAQGSRNNLPSPLEGREEEELDPYLDQGGQQSAVNEANYPQTIRTVQSDSQSLDYQSEERQQQWEAQQQHLREQPEQPNVDIGTHNYYQSHLQQPQVNISPASAISTSDQYRQYNAETSSQISYDSPLDQREDTRPGSVQSNKGQSGAPVLAVPHRGADNPNRVATIPQSTRPQSFQTGGNMAPPSGSRRSADANKILQGAQQGSSEPPPNYSRNTFSPLPPTPGQTAVSATQAGIAAGANYRGGPPQREQSGVGEQGRSTPPPPAVPGGQDIHEEYKQLSTKYKKVKGLYFDKTAQVEQLQNTLANQRLSQSRTSLDDGEYTTRFQRLEGAITNLAFNIRKDWRSVPPWISQYVNKDAMSIGKQEMTAVGRACITKYIMEEIFEKTFHPGLDPSLSINLKQIERNIRRNSPPPNNPEEFEALTAKVVQWRLVTLEGLKDVLMSAKSEDNKVLFAQLATTKLAANLITFLEPTPAGLEDSAHMIVELAVGIASNIPLESRDISVVYPMPGDMLQLHMMRIENPIAALENPGAECGDGDTASTISGEKDDSKDSEKSSDGKSRKDKSKSGMLSGLMGSSSAGSKKQAAQDATAEAKKISMEEGTQTVRFAGFVSIEVKGRTVLAKAPVWTVS